MLMYSKWYCTLVHCTVHGPLGPPRLARAAAPDDQQFMAPAAPPPPSSVGSHHAPQPHNGHPGVLLSPLSPAPYVSIQQPRICSKLSGLKSSQSGPLHPLSAAGMGSVKSLDNDNRWSELAEVAHFGFPPLLLTETLFRTRPYTWKLCIYQKLALALTIPINQFRINSKKKGKLVSMSFSPKIGCIAHLPKTGKSCPPFPPWPLLRVGSRQGLVALQLFTRQEECQSRHSSAELHYYRFNLPVLHYIDKLLTSGRVLCHLCIP